MLVAGAGVFAAASAVAATAPSAEALVVARGLQGLGGAALLPSIMALVFGMFRDERQRTTALGVVMGSFALGAALGPLLGGALLELFSWRAAFWVNVPMMALVVVLAPRLVPAIRGGLTGRVDLPSAALSLVGILAAVHGIKRAAQDGLEPAAVANIVAGAVLIAAFVARQRRLAEPLVDVRLFGRAPFSTALGAAAVGMFVTYGTVFFTAQHLQLVAGLSPLEAGLWGLPPVAVVMIASAGIVPQLATRVRPAFLVAGGMVVAAAGLFVLAGLDADAGPAAVAASLAIVFAGLAPATTLGMGLIVGSAPPEQAGAVSGLGQTGNELGGALGIALLGSVGAAIYQDRMAAALDGVPAAIAAPASETLGAVAGLATQLPAGTAEVATRAFSAGLGTAATAGAALLLLTAASTAVLLRRAPVVAAPAAAAPAEAEMFPSPAIPLAEAA
jgi:DHA2 family multidrug resistance protein-like MFS transporter